MGGALIIATSAWGFVITSFGPHPAWLDGDAYVAFTMLTLRLSLVLTGALFLLMGWDVMRAESLRAFHAYTGETP